MSQQTGSMFSLPFESTINTAVEKIADGVITKMNHAEEKRNREFTYQLKELEFYKSNYEKDLKDIFDYWFDLVRTVQIKDNKNLTEQERNEYQKKYAKLNSVDKVSKYKMNTLKYGGTETGRVLAIANRLLQKKFEDQPKHTPLVMWCSVLAVLKKDILGQELDPVDIIRVLVNDYDSNIQNVEDAKLYIKKVYKETYGENPSWIK